MIETMVHVFPCGTGNGKEGGRSAPMQTEHRVTRNEVGLIGV